MTAMLVLLLAGVGVFSINRMTVLKETSNDLANNWVVATGQVGSLNADVANYRRMAWQHIQTPEGAPMSDLEKQMDALRVDVDKVRDAYAKTIGTDPRERQLFDATGATWNAYLEKAKVQVDLSRSGQRAQAGVYASENVRPVADQVEKSIEALKAYNLEMGGKAGLDAAATAKAAITMVIGSIVGALLLASAAAFLIIRNVTTGLTAVTQPMGGLARGELTVEVPFRGFKTEIGQIADAVQVFKDALIEKKRMDEAAAQEAEVKLQRGRRLEQLMADFESQIGTLTGALAGAATEMEATAGAMTGTAGEASQRHGRYSL